MRTSTFHLNLFLINLIPELQLNSIDSCQLIELHNCVSCRLSECFFSPSLSLLNLKIYLNEIDPSRKSTNNSQQSLLFYDISKLFIFSVNNQDRCQSSSDRLYMYDKLKTCLYICYIIFIHSQLISKTEYICTSTNICKLKVFIDISIENEPRLTFLCSLLNCISKENVHIVSITYKLNQFEDDAVVLIDSCSMYVHSVKEQQQNMRPICSLYMLTIKEHIFNRGKGKENRIEENVRTIKRKNMNNKQINHPKYLIHSIISCIPATF